MATQSQIRDEINKQLIEALKSNTIVPWQQPWTNASCVMPANILSTFPYRGIDPILLRIAAINHGYGSRWWGTERQWKVLGGKLRPEAKGAKLYHQDALLPGVIDPVIKYRVVYNLDSVDGGKFDTFRIVPDVNLSEATDGHGNHLWEMEGGRGLVNIEAERIIKATGADFREEPRNGALYYRLPLDYIVVPMMSQFHYGPGGPAAYYQTAFHELTHWTEHRLIWYADPKLSIKKRYALGELRADIASAYLCAECGIPPQKNELNFDSRQNFARYVKHWVVLMEEDNSVIFRMARAASEAADYILSFAERAKTEGREQDKPKAQESPRQSASDTGTVAGQLEYSFFKDGESPPSPEARRAYLNPNRGPTQKYPNPSPYYGFIGNRDAVNLLMGIDFDALGKYNHLCRDTALAFVGPHGCGKTDLARRHAKVNMLPLVELSPRSIKTAQDILEELKRVWKSHNMPLIEVCRPKLYKVPPTNVLIDDIDPSSLQPLLATVMSDSVMTQSTMITEQGYTVDVQNLHWMVAATDFGNMPPLFSQWFTTVTFSPYTQDEIAQIVKLHQPDWEMAICKLVAGRCPNVPGEALGFAKEMLLAYNLSPGPWDQIAARVEEQRKGLSMSINVQCSSCKGKCHVAQGWLGHAVECPFCHKTFKAVAIEQEVEIIPDELDLALDDVPGFQPTSGPDSDVFALDEEPDVQATNEPDSKIIPLDEEVADSEEHVAFDDLAFDEADEAAFDEEPDVQATNEPDSKIIPLDEEVADSEEHVDFDLAVVEADEAASAPVNCPACGTPLLLSGNEPWTCAHCKAQFGIYSCPFCKTSQYKTITGEYFEWNCVQCRKLIYVGEPPPAPKEKQKLKSKSHKPVERLPEQDDVLEVIPVTNQVYVPKRDCPNCGRTKRLDGEGPWTCLHCNTEFNRFTCPNCQRENYKAITGDFLQWNCIQCHEPISVGEPPTAPKKKLKKKSKEQSAQAPPPPVEFAPSYMTGVFGQMLRARCPRCQGVVYWGPCSNCGGTRWRIGRTSDYLWLLMWYSKVHTLECTGCGANHSSWYCNCGCEVHASFFAKDFPSGFRLE